MLGLADSHFSIYQVRDIIQGKSFVAHDSIYGFEPILISEKTATKSFREGQYIAARVIKTASKNYVSGGVMLVPRILAFDLIEEYSKHQRYTSGRKVSKKMLKFKARLSSLPLCGDFADNLVLSSINKEPLESASLDGDEYCNIKVSYKLKKGAKTEEVRTLIDQCKELSKLDKNNWQYLIKQKPILKNNDSEKKEYEQFIGIQAFIYLKSRKLSISTFSRDSAKYLTGIVEEKVGLLLDNADTQFLGPEEVDIEVKLLQELASIEPQFDVSEFSLDDFE